MIFGHDGSITERDTLMCRHGQHLIELKPGSMGQVYLVRDEDAPLGYREEAGAYCSSCAGPICLACDRQQRAAGPRGGCERGSEYFERTIERIEARDRMLRSVLLG